MNIKIGTYNLAGDDWNEKVSDLEINWTRDVTVQKHFRAKYPKLRYSGNQQATITFNVARLHANYAAALKFQLDHAEAIPASGNVVIDERTEGGLVTRQFVMAYPPTFGVRRIGVTTLHNYQIIGTQISTPTKAGLLLRQAQAIANIGSTTSEDAFQNFDVVATRAELKVTYSDSRREVVFVTNPEPGVQRCYIYVHGDTTAADDESIIAPNDDMGRYFQFNP